MNQDKICLVTGANGFVGRQVCLALLNNGYKVRGAFRQSHSDENIGVQDEIIVGAIGPDTDWHEALLNVDYVIHLAARVHVMREVASDPLSEFREINTAGTAHLAEEAASHGVRRFVYVSSIKVNGEVTNNEPFVADDDPDPKDPYAISKTEAEVLLREIESRTNMEVVIVRPPLIYGPGVKGNFLRLVRLMGLGLPLPLSMIHNKRSMVSLQNMADVLLRCLEHPKAAGETFLVSDGVDWSTPELTRSIARHFGKPARLFPIPVSLLKLIGRLTGRLNMVDRLCDSLELDIHKTCKLLDWSPPQDPDVGIQQTVDWYLNNKNV